MLSIHDEIARLQPISLPATVENPATGSGADRTLLDILDEVTKTIGRLGRQQLRANQQHDLLADELRTAIEQLRSDAEAARDQAESYRRELQRQQNEARERAERVLEIMDVLDELSALVRQKGDPQWAKHLDRLTTRTIQILEQVGYSEVNAEGALFNEEEHEVVEAIDRVAGQEPYRVVEVIHRGFRWNGRVLRRAQVVSTR